MTTTDFNRKSFATIDTFRSAPLFPETNRGVQQASSAEDRPTDEASDERSNAWRAVMASHLL